MTNLNEMKGVMPITKLEIVVAMAAAKLQHSGYLAGDNDLKEYEKLADKILNLFPIAVEGVKED